MIPQQISRPIEEAFCNNDTIGDARITLRVPAYTGHLTTMTFGTTPREVSSFPVTVPVDQWTYPGMTQEIDSGAGFGDISLVKVPYSGADGVSSAKWSVTDVQSLSDAPTEYTPFPLPIAYDDTENTTLAIKINTNAETLINVIWFRSDFLPSSTLAT